MGADKCSLMRIDTILASAFSSLLAKLNGDFANVWGSDFSERWPNFWKKEESDFVIWCQIRDLTSNERGGQM